MMYKFRDIQEIYIFHVYNKLMNTAEEFNVDETFNPMTELGVSPTLVRKALEGLITRELMLYRKDLSSLGGRYYEISAEGIEYVERQLLDGDSTIAKYAQTLGASAGANSSVPASDRVVALNHNSEPYKSAIESLDKTIEAIRTANDIGTATADEREAIVAEMSAIKRLLEATKVRAAQALSLAAPTFQFIAKTFTQEGLKRLAAAAWDALKTLLA